MQTGAEKRRSASFPGFPSHYCSFRQRCPKCTSVQSDATRCPLLLQPVLQSKPHPYRSCEGGFPMRSMPVASRSSKCHFFEARRYFVPSLVIRYRTGFPRSFMRTCGRPSMSTSSEFGGSGNVRVGLNGLATVMAFLRGAIRRVKYTRRHAARQVRFGIGTRHSTNLRHSFG